MEDTTETTPVNITIQQATQQDLEQIVDLALALETELKGSWDPDRELPSRDDLTERYRSRIDDQTYKIVLAKRGDKVIGYLFGWINPERRQDTLWIQGVYMEPGSRNFVTVRRMFSEFEEFAKSKNINKIGGQVYKNSRQHQLFKLVGCSDVEETPDGKEIIISKTLAPRVSL